MILRKPQAHGTLASWSATATETDAVPTSSSPVVRRRQLAAELRRLRANRSGSEVARGINWSATKISRAESGRDGIPPDEVEKLLDFYGVADPLRSQLLGLAEDATRRGWWEDYADVLGPGYQEFIGLEAEATSISNWQSDVMPGLLQTEDYARELSLAYQRIVPTTTPSEIERVVQVRMIRQQRLTHDPVLQLSVVLDEAVLLRKIGSHELMRTQLAHLARVASRPNVDLRILPLKQEASLAMTPFQILRFSSHATGGLNRLADMVSIETLRAELIDDEPDIHLHRLFFQALTGAALSSEESMRMLVSLAERVLV
jgi:hypothetical protein